MNTRSVLIAAVMMLASIGAAQDPESQTVARRENDGRAFVRLLTERRFDDGVAMFDSTMKTVMPAARLEEAWNSVLKQAGKFREQLGVRHQKYAIYDIIFVTCRFEGSPMDVRVVFDQAGKIAGLFFSPPQSVAEYSTPPYAERESFREVEVTVGSGKWSLGGTLSLPNGERRWPAVVLVHGSGPNDRDETIGPNKPFRDIAWGLASRGIAVLRYEKRTRQHASEMIEFRKTLTVNEETIDDACEAVAFLRTRSEIDTNRIFVLGHSLGGMLVPRVALRDARIAGFIILAGATRPIEDVIVEQFTYIFGLDGTIDDQEQSRLADVRKQRDGVKMLTPADTAAQALFAAPASYWLDLRNYDPPAVAAKLHVPLLILQGGRDYQVTNTDFERWRTALRNKPNVSFSLYPLLNHLFIEGEGQSTPSEYDRPGHVSEAVITDILRWLSR